MSATRLTGTPGLSTIDRLDDARVLRADSATSWLITGALVLLGFALRVVNIGRPSYIVFDETYYAKEAWSILHFGYARDWLPNADASVNSGTPDVWGTGADFVVHPMLGKWLIAIGEHLFGMNAFGWRFASLIFGSLLIGTTVRMARRLSRSTMVGAIAGFLLCVDGLSFMMSRIALLDIFQAFFTVAGVACVVTDRDWFRHKLAEYLRANNLINLGGHFGPLLLWRPWRLLAGIMFGLAIGVKWNAIYVLAAMGIISVIFDWRSRFTARARLAAWRSVYQEGPLAFVYLVVVAGGVYLATWASWLKTLGGYGRMWGVNNPDATSVKVFGAPLASLFQYHKEIYDFHVGEYMAEVTHTYEAHPAGWLVIGRTTGIDAVNGIQPGTDGCTAVDDTCLRIISGIGTPVLWWMAAIALVAGMIFWVFGRDWRFGLPIIAMGSTWLMWFPSADRPLFYFYAIMMIPFTATVLAMCFGRILGPAERSKRRRTGAMIVGGGVVLILLNFAFIYPILTDELMTRTAWQWRMWFRSWI